MPDLPKKTISELIALYQLEPSVVDIFVEGPDDEIIIRWYLNRVHREKLGIGIYVIDDIEVPAQVLSRYHLRVGNRSEVIGLCKEIEEQFGDQFVRATGIIDSDFTFFFTRSRHIRSRAEN
jgi:hypothetical protein